MLARLDAAFASQRRFVANASHELRTPLTVMRTAIDVTLAKPGRTQAQLEAMAAEVRQAVDRAEALIEALLTLARSDRGTGAREQLDLAVLAEDALDAAAPAIRACPVTVDAALGPAPPSVTRYCSSGWSPTWSTTPSGTTCRTAGCGWPPGTRERHGVHRRRQRRGADPRELVPSLFEPFRRLADRGGSPEGSGLGLSIVRSVVIAHHGQLTASARPSGRPG